MGNVSSRKGAIGALAVIAASLTISGCSMLGIGGDDGVPKDAKCPEVRILPELSSLHRFAGATTSFTDLAYTAGITNLESDCDLAIDKAVVTLTFRMTAERGPRSSGAAQFPYFIAVADPDGKIVAKRVVNAGFDFAQGQAREGAVRTETETVSYSDPKDAEDYAVIIGLQLTPQERDYNRNTDAGK